MPAARLRVLSGIQPTGGGSHLGNYLGAVRQWVALQDTHDPYYCVVDLHALTVGPEPDAVRRRTLESVAELLAVGVDPTRCTLFVQSHVTETTELAWVLSCLTGFGEAGRMTQFKDKSQRAGGADGPTVGLFTYPILQAADILVFRADAVPVGEDQRQHLELTRHLAQRFNTRFGPTFTVPEPHIPPDTGKVLDLASPDRQMSKSVGGAGVVFLQDPPDVIRKKIRSSVTDTGREIRAGEDKPGMTNLLRIYAAVTGRSITELEAGYAGRGYGEFKSELAEQIVELVLPMQARYLEYLADPGGLEAIVAEGAKRARAVASATMEVVRDRIGLLPARG
ncbi:MAG TPA: tryptophan--tRNA ligase [Mycobacteriales bacterium]|nr:tryptophan--tRNA ligase [Mycobacteriales bacterium]